MRLKVSIGVRLFLLVSLSMAAVAAVGLGLVRWRFADAAPSVTGQAARDDVSGLMRSLASGYRAHGGWSFVPVEPARRAAWLREQLAASPVTPGAAPEGNASLGYRVGLLDAQGHYLAGVLADPLLVMLASIDRVRRDVVVDGRTVGYLLLAKPRNPDDALAVAFLLQQQRNLGLLALIGMVLSGMAAALLAVGFRRPIRALAQGARRLGSGHFETRVDARRGDELGELAHVFNQLAARLEDAERARRQWVADTSHELRTPLAVLRAQLEALHDDIRPATRENLALLLRQAGALEALIDDLYAMARADVGQLPYAMVPLDAWTLVEEVWRGFADRFRAHRLQATLTAPDGQARVLADGERLRQVLSNLFENSTRYTAPGGCIELAGAITDGTLQIRLDDSAPGVPMAMLERLGERFFRVDPSRSRELGGAGLGLALSRQLVEAHGGSLAFASSPLGGLRVTLTLPLER